MYCIEIMPINPRRDTIRFYLPIVNEHVVRLCVVGLLGELFDFKDIYLKPLPFGQYIAFTDDEQVIRFSMRKIGSMMPGYIEGT